MQKFGYFNQPIIEFVGGATIQRGLKAMVLGSLDAASVIEGFQATRDAKRRDAKIFFSQQVSVIAKGVSSRDPYFPLNATYNFWDSLFFFADRWALQRPCYFFALPQFSPPCNLFQRQWNKQKTYQQVFIFYWRNWTTIDNIFFYRFQDRYKTRKYKQHKIVHIESNKFSVDAKYNIGWHAF